jgi:modification methylase
MSEERKQSKERKAGQNPAKRTPKPRAAPKPPAAKAQASKRQPAKTQTSAFGTGRRESHDASSFYARSLYAGQSAAQPATPRAEDAPAPHPVTPPAPEGWAERIYCASSTQMDAVPDNSVALAFTSPPYNVGKEYDENLSLEAYLTLIRDVAREIYRVLVPGGRYVVNIANVGRKPYIPLHALYYPLHTELGFLPMGEIIWRKGKGANGSCAWGSWMSAKSPRLRDVHEYLLVFAKAAFARPDRGESDIERDAFMQATLSVWEIQPVSAKRIGHPAPFPEELADRVIRLYSYVDDVVLDPFAGSGTTCVAAAKAGRHYVGYEIEPSFVELAQNRLSAIEPNSLDSTPND